MADLGPDYADGTCSRAKGNRHHRKNGVVCDYTAQDEQYEDGPYRRWIGATSRLDAPSAPLAASQDRQSAGGAAVFD